MTLYGNDGNIYTILNKINNGGEGDIHDVQGYPGFVAKVFHKEKLGKKGRWAKVESWTKMSSLDSSFLDQVVIPKVALYNSLNMNALTFQGYLMERVSGYESLKKIYSTNNFEYYKKVFIAKNLCILTNKVHSIGHVVGDYHPDNVVVFPTNGRIKFIDADSFQFVIYTGRKKMFLPCTVGLPEFLAPEIHRRLIREKADLESISQTSTNPVFSVYTDRYALAYHIFSLLMGGCAPFAEMVDITELSKHPSKNVSNVDLNTLRAAREGEFIYSKKVPFKTAPEYAPDYQILTPNLKKLFERAFADGASDPKARPDEKEFYAALDEYYNTLVLLPCGHYMPSYYRGECEWDRIKRVRDKMSKPY